MDGLIPEKLKSSKPFLITMPNSIAKQPKFGRPGLDWLCCSAGKSKMAPNIYIILILIHSSLTAKYTKETIGERWSNPSTPHSVSNQTETGHGTMHCSIVPSQISQACLRLTDPKS